MSSGSAFSWCTQTSAKAGGTSAYGRRRYMPFTAPNPALRTSIFSTRGRLLLTFSPLMSRAKDALQTLRRLAELTKARVVTRLAKQRD
eukprot:CAMPEP_0118950924 /NCGR_PEP_ID=MMETSP1169-20130426/52233_1 /TAXON_ID=36882 /ORGANISM="Pyramimonas obovata, Strain CCMP722" /LENGTH=87 /DNA_ID=CAMNT_0006897867 /DNA_START=192 /DNA_END=452 /DNA_ORIENTATION=+